MKWMGLAGMVDPCCDLSFGLRQRLPVCREESKKKKIGLRCFYALDVRAEFAQFFIEMFVASVDVIHPTHFGSSICFQSRKHQRGRGAQIARHHWSAKEMIDALDHRSRAFKIDMCAHQRLLRDMLVAFRNNFICDVTYADVRREDTR